MNEPPRIPPYPPAPLFPDNSAPPRIPQYELIKVIGAGSYGAVWLARTQTGSFHAVKVIYQRTFDDDRPYQREFEGIQRFEPISRLHPSQVDVLHVGRNDDDRFFYYVMELADDANAPLPSLDASLSFPPESTGSTRSALPPRLESPESYQPCTLRSVLSKRGALPAELCVRIGLGLAEALDHLHSHGLVHRDIKPSNIIFTQGRPKLADIGLVAQADATLSFVGTEGYIPPEGPGKPQADIFSLGMVLYEAVTGKHRKDFPDPPAPGSIRGTRKAFQELNEVILKACDAFPGNRYPTASQLARDLQAIRDGRSVRWRHWRDRWIPTCLKLAAAAAALAATAVGTNRWLRSQSTGAADLVKAPSTVPYVGQELELNNPHNPRDFDVSADGAKIVYCKDGAPFLFDRQTYRTEPILVDTARQWRMRLPRWAPDGETVALVGVARVASGQRTPPGARATLFVAALTPQGGARPVRDDLSWSAVRGIAWDVGGGHVTVVSRGDPPFDVGLDGSKRPWLDSAEENNPSTRIGNFSANGKWLIANRHFSELWLLGRTEERRLLAIENALLYHPTWDLRGESLFYVTKPVRQEERDYKILRLDIDQTTGLPRGEPRQLATLPLSAAWHPLPIENNGRKLMFFKLFRYSKILYADNPMLANAIQLAQGFGAIISPDGRAVYYVNPDGGEPGIYRTSPQSIAPQPIVAVPNLSSYDLSNDGRRLAYTVSEAGKIHLFVIEPDQSPAIEVYNAQAEVASPPHWSPDGTHIALTRNRHDVIVIRADGQGHRILCSLPHIESQPWWSPGGDAIAIAVCSNAETRFDDDAPYSVMLVPLNGEPPRSLTPPDQLGLAEGLRWHPSGEFLTFNRYPPNPQVSRATDGIWQAFVDGRPPVLLLDQTDGHWNHYGEWHPSGRTFYYLGGDCPFGGSAVHIYDRQTGAVEHNAGIHDVPSWDAAGIQAVWRVRETMPEVQILDLE